MDICAVCGKEREKKRGKPFFQRAVARFAARHGLVLTAEAAVLDLASEVGELAKALLA